jgi:hypothetical protein
VRVTDPILKFALPLRRDTARVLYAWLERTDLSLIPMDHKAEKQAFSDLCSWLQTDCDVGYISADEMARAHDQLLIAPNSLDDAGVPLDVVDLWRSDVLVIYAWLERVDLATLRDTTETEKRALAELHACLRFYTDGSRVSEKEIAVAREEVSRDMGW